MKRFGWIALAVLACSLPASAGNYYFDVFAGIGDSDETDFGVLGTSVIETEFDSTFTYGVAFGYAFENQWRLEGESTRREADVDTHELDGGGAIAGSFGEGNSTSIFANVLYDFANDSRVTPYLGFGLGNVMVDYANFGVPGLDALDDHDDVIGYQLIVGMTAEIKNAWAFRADLRWVGAEDAELTSSAATGSTTSDVSYQAYDLTVGFRYKF